MPEQIYDMTQGWNSLAAEMLYAFMKKDGVPAEELAFYERRIRANGGLALDQACGTGRHIFPLLARGLEVHGADISADALKLAEKEAAAANTPITLYHQSMEACDIPHRYGTIYVANCTFQIITERIASRRSRRCNASGSILCRAANCCLNSRCLRKSLRDHPVMRNIRSGGTPPHSETCRGRWSPRCGRNPRISLSKWCCRNGGMTSM